MHSRNVRIGGPMTPWVKRLMIINGAVFLFQLILGIYFGGSRVTPFDQFFGLSHVGFIGEFKLWQIFTYMFLHGGAWHLFFNLLALWMFAGEIEQLWGSQLFLKFYIYCGVGAGFFISLLNFVVFSKYNSSPLTIGASGAIYGILLAYGMTWPNREVLLMLIFPIKIKYLVIGLGILEFFGTVSSLGGQGGGISHIGHLGGLITGFIFIYLNSKRTSLNTKKATLGGSFLGGTVKKMKLKKKKKQIDDRIKAKRIIDELLEKIARTGMSSLSAEEKKKLEWARKNYHPNGHDTLH